MFCVYVVTNVWWVLFNCLHVSLAFVFSQTLCGFCLNDCIFCLYPHKRMVCSFYMFAYFAFLSQTYLVFWWNVCIFCIFVVTKVWWVLFKCLDVLYLCRHKRTSFWLNVACFNVYFCRHKRMVCSVLPLFNALSLKFMLYKRNLCIVSSVELLKNSLEKTLTCLFSIHLQSISVTMIIDNNTFAHHWVFKTKLKFFKFFPALTLSF